MRIANCGLPIVCCAMVFWAGSASGQESPTPTASSASAEPTVTPTTTPVRSVRISFVPPPLDGTVSLGIYDTNGKLVRVLHQQAPIDEFTIGADALQTKWDGKDDYGQDLPSGKYQAHGFTVGPLQIESMALDPAASPPQTGNDKIAIRLTANPLVKNDRPNVQLAVGFDDTDSFVKTADGLPLFVISERAGITSITATKFGEKSIEVWQNSPAGTEHLRVSKVDQMMAFDCGAFDLK
jgi:hypothetical protein